MGSQATVQVSSANEGAHEMSRPDFDSLTRAVSAGGDDLRVINMLIALFAVVCVMAALAGTFLR
ncbi:MAG: hypothetical protein QOJ13_639 [Gaiellales bacterium]|jgi:hypothetical protein|nr:hypothetical protein [Gaiellales bacterium]